MTREFPVSQNKKEMKKGANSNGVADKSGSWGSVEAFQLPMGYLYATRYVLVDDSKPELRIERGLGGGKVLEWTKPLLVLAPHSLPG